MDHTNDRAASRAPHCTQPGADAQRRPDRSQPLAGELDALVALCHGAGADHAVAPYRLTSAPAARLQAGIVTLRQRLDFLENEVERLHQWVRSAGAHTNARGADPEARLQFAAAAQRSRPN